MAEPERERPQSGASRRTVPLIDNPLSGALVTGAGSGIGAATAKALARDGFGVVCADRDLDAARETAKDLEHAVAVSVDVRSEVDVERAVDVARSRFGGLSAAASCAGIHRFGDAISMERSAFEEVLAVNLTGTYITAVGAAQEMVNAGVGGSIVLIGSMNSAVVSLPGQVAYAPSKGGVLSLAEALAAQFARTGIRVNAVLPGVTDTPLSASTLNDRARRASALSRVPIGRPATPRDVAESVSFLVSSRSRGVTGAAVPVDGGQLALTSMFPWVV